MLTSLDRRYLFAALRLGNAQLGRTWPNPAVGCLIVRDGRVIGMGATGHGGRPHGERIALPEAGEAAHGAAAYVSLEPCNHHGKTPPCSQALIEAGVARVVIALGDPDPRVSGSGVEALRAAGITVDFEPFADVAAMARQAHQGHIMRQCSGRPYTTLKLALSLDGGIGVHEQGQVAITSAATNRIMHGKRARMDGIAIGAGTLRADEPRLTVRLPGLQHRSPKRFVLGGSSAPDGFDHLPGHDLAASLQRLGHEGITRLLVEGGSEIARALLADGLADEIILIKGTTILGPQAIRPFAADPFDDLEAAGLADWAVSSRRTIADDTMMVLRPAH